MIALAATGFGLVTFFSRSLTDAGLASPAIAFYRYVLSALVMLPFLYLRRPLRSATLWAMGAGLSMGLGWIAYIEAIEDVDVSTVGVIYMTYPLFTVAAAWLLFGHQPTRRSLLGGVLVVAAAAVALSPAAIDTDETTKLVLAFLAPLTFGFSISVLTERLIPLHPFERIAGVTLGAVLGLSPLMIALPGDEVVPEPGSDWLLIAGIATVTSVVPQVAYSVAAPFIGPARTATAGAVELPTIFVIGWLAFDESIGLLQMLAGALVIGAVLITPSRPAPAAVADPQPVDRQ